MQLVSTRQLDPRTLDLTFRTKALTHDTSVRILLPTDYNPTRRYPVLYLLQGGVDNYTSWTRSGDAAKLTAGLPLIVVMPDAGQGGWYTDWYNNGAFGPPQWETYHLRQLLPWIDTHFPTVANRAGRALAGESMGGFGVLSYAARHPDMFVAAAAFSPAADLNVPAGVAPPVIYATSSFDGGDPTSVFGLRQTDEVRWRAHNPWDLAENLRGLSITLRTGNGQGGGPYGGGGADDPYGATIEAAVEQEAISLHQRLQQLGIDHTWDDYGPGSHSWPYWQRDLRESLPTIMETFAHPPAPPSPVNFTAAEPSYAVYGWAVEIDRAAMEFSQLRNADASGFTLTGSGTATVTTPALYPPCQAYDVLITSSAGAQRFTELTDGSGRLQIHLPLGPPNLQQEQFTPDGDGRPVGSLTYTSTAVISRSFAHSRPGNSTCRSGPSESP